MISLEDALERVLAAASPLPPRIEALDRCVGLVLAEPVLASQPVPPFDNSAMDGYAVCHTDLESVPTVLPVVTVSAAGRPSDRRIAAEEAARILTGAVMVDGADTVVPVEATREVDPPPGRDGTWVEIRDAVPSGSHVRRAGEDLAKGDVALQSGKQLGPSDVGLAASCGTSSLTVVPRPRVAVVSTGDELVAPGEGPLLPGQIYDSNRMTIAAALRTRCGTRDVTTVHVGDEPERCLADLADLAGSHDVLLTTGGVSMGGEFDVVKVALGNAGGRADVDFWQIAIKPAKPLAFGRVEGALFVGLPGNPVSALVAFELFVRPLLRGLAGVEPVVPPRSRGELGERMHKRQDGKVHFVRVRRDPDGRYRGAGAQGSHQLRAMAAADALAVLPDGHDPFEPGCVVDLIEL
ncbi:MAG: molybdopterin molybdotransferase MoeA [Acidimicrobiia bacterium]|nr:molybdopterin molybdotransferase MoeA [Acidimicrobiia bacterium]